MSRTSYHVVRLEIPQGSLAWMRGKLFFEEDCLGLQKEKVGQDKMILRAYFVAKTPLLEFLEFIKGEFPEVTEVEGMTINTHTADSHVQYEIFRRVND